LLVTRVFDLSPSTIRTLGSSIVVSSLEFFFSCPSFGLYENLYVVAVYIIFHATSPAKFIFFFFSFFSKSIKLHHVTIRALRPMRLPNHIKKYISLFLYSFCFSLGNAFLFYIFFILDVRAYISNVSKSSKIKTYNMRKKIILNSSFSFLSSFFYSVDLI